MSAKRRRVDPLTDRANTNMQAHLRRLVHAACAQRQYASAAWFADKLVTAGDEQASDVLLLASCLFHNGEYQRALHVLSHHGLIDSVMHRHPSRRVAEAAGMAAAIGSGGVLVDPAVSRSVASTLGAAEHTDTLSGAVSLSALPAFLLAAQCHKEMKAWDRCVPC